ncbi:hypothetical protein ZOSMA_58G00080 [Zostera marina]|uniref:DUF6821 domain-containing protein n=1 Tax=Zostera marina TaxID=29655 RepID=A0A0K9NWX6_ZOSMR|nr:hypothetical protein ZOSMA_58G00080 [Zostera marina]
MDSSVLLPPPYSPPDISDDGLLNGRKKKKNSAKEFREVPVSDDGFVNEREKEKSIPKEIMEIPKSDMDLIKEIGKIPKETTSHEEVISGALSYNKKVQDPKFADMEIAPEKDADADDKAEAEAEEDEGDRKDGDPVKKDRCCWDGFGLNIWKWRLTGIGALCSIGVAAAATTTIYMFILGSTQRQKQHHMNQKLPLKICPDDKV